MSNNKNLPRGIRNNNPGNIKIANNDWRGKVPVSENTDGVFEQFKEYDGKHGMVWGTRALTKLIWTYLGQFSGHTILTFVKKYAPASENNVDAYAKSIAEYMQIHVNTHLSDFINIPDKQYLFILAIIRHENGIAYDNQHISDGIELGNQ